METVENIDFSECLTDGAWRLGIRVEPSMAHQFGWLKDELLRWNRKVNLTALGTEQEILEKHFLDSVAVAPDLDGVATLLDLGSGAGFPGLPIKLIMPGIRVFMVDAVAKKVAFIKHALVGLGLVGGAQAFHAKAEGRPDKENLPRADAVIGRAFLEPAAWLHLARSYTKDKGRIIAMLGAARNEDELASLASEVGLVLRSFRKFELPFSGSARAIAVFEQKGKAG